MIDHHKIGRASRNKGKRGEREFANICKDKGFPNAHRTAQFRGNTGAAGDVEGLPGIHIECKFVENLNLRAAMEQSRNDAAANGNGDFPIVVHKKSRQPWLITMDIDDWFELYKAWRKENGD